MSMRLGGLDIIMATEHPRYTLPAEVLPGVPWPAGFKEDTDAWARRVCGTTCLVPRGQALMDGTKVILHPEDYIALRNKTKDYVSF